MNRSHSHKNLDVVFEALANKHRREIIYALGLQPHTISQLGKMRRLSLPAIHKHIKILENAKIITAKKIGRSNFLTLNRESLLGLQNWLAQFHAHWGNAKESLTNYGRYLTKEHSKKGGEK